MIWNKVIKLLGNPKLILVAMLGDLQIASCNTALKKYLRLTLDTELSLGNFETMTE